MRLSATDRSSPPARDRHSLNPSGVGRESSTQGRASSLWGHKCPQVHPHSSWDSASSLVVMGSTAPKQAGTATAGWVTAPQSQAGQQRSWSCTTQGKEHLGGFAASPEKRLSWVRSSHGQKLAWFVLCFWIPLPRGGRAVNDVLCQP